MLQIIALLYANDGDIGALRAFESQVYPIIREHGGTLLTAFKPMPTDGDTPDEIHVLQFPAKTDLDAYLSDERVLALSDQRQSAIARTVLYMSDTFVTY